MHRKDLLGLRDVRAEEITEILDTATRFREVSRRRIKKVPTLRGRTVVSLFFENSTRTRVSFDLAAKRLSADGVNISDVSSARRWIRVRPTSTTEPAGTSDSITFVLPM